MLFINEEQRPFMDFFKNKYSASKSRRIFLEIIRKVFNLSEFDREVSFDRIFPNQDYHSGKGLGNLVALPLNGRRIKENKMVFLDHESFNPIKDQWNYLSKFLVYPFAFEGKLIQYI